MYKIGSTIKGIPRMILLTILIILSVILKPILKLGAQIVSMLRGEKGGVGGEGGERDGFDRDNDNDDDSNESIFDNETLARIMSDLSTSSITDLLNRAFTGDLFAMRDKNNNLSHERDLLSEGKDIIKNIDILNYRSLDSTLLVGEVFMQLQDARWKKEKIDHTNKHILEELKDDIFNENYSFFTKAHDWTIHEVDLDDDDYPGLLLQPAAVIKGKNSIVCPRGYIPVLSPESKKMLKENNINYELYCIKNLGYYFLILSKSIPAELKIYYKRYGDKRYNGIFFNTQENQPEGGYIDIAETLREPLVQVEDLPKEVYDVVYDQQFVTEPEKIVKTNTKYLGTDYEYSDKKAHTTQEYVKHPSYLVGMAHTKVGDCKNVNTMNIALLRHNQIQAQMCAGYVYDQDKDGFEGHAITEANIDGKCLLADATPNSMFSGGDDVQLAKKKSKFQEQFEKRTNAVDEAKADINAFFAQYADKYNKRLEKRKKRREEEMKNRLQIDELDIERKRNECMTELSLAATSPGISTRIVEIFLHYLQSLPNSAILRKAMPHESYIQCITLYVARLEQWRRVINTIRNKGYPEDLQNLHRELTRELANELERMTAFNTTLMKANNLVGGEYTRDDILAKVLKHNGNVGRNTLTDNPKYGISQEYDVYYAHLLKECTFPSIVEQFMPLDISLYVEKYKAELQKHIEETTNDKEESKDKDDNENDDGDTKEDKKEEEKKLLAPQKAKTLILSAFKILCQNFIDEVGKEGTGGTYNDHYRFKLLIQNSINLCDHIDEGFWLQRDKKEVEEIIKPMESIREESLGKLLKFAPIRTNQHFFSWKPFYQISLLLRMHKGGGFKDYDNNGPIENYMKLFGTEDPFARELKVACTNYRYNGNLLHDAHNAQDSTWEVEAAVRSKMDSLSSYNSDLRLSDQDIVETINVYQAQLLEKYAHNHPARLSILTTQKKVDHKDRSLILESINELGAQTELSEKEKLVIEKAIVYMVNNIIRYSAPDESDRNFLLQQFQHQQGFSIKNLEKSLNAINSEYVIDVISRLHGIYSKRMKLLKKGNLVDAQAKRMRENADNLIDIFQVCKDSLKNYTLQNKNSFGVTILEFRINNLIRSFEKIRPIPEYGRQQRGGDM